ncbi:MAG: MFS transporter [Acidiferrobacteraceae bacterium]
MSNGPLLFFCTRCHGWGRTLPCAPRSVSSFFIEFGPNTTIFLLPTEVFPTNVRGMGRGVSTAAGKTGAAIGAFLLPIVLSLGGVAINARYTCRGIACRGGAHVVRDP